MQQLERFIGIPYCPRRMDCADLAMLVQRDLFGRQVLLAGKRPRPLDTVAQDMALNAYTETKQDCSLIIQKCVKYIDYEKCGDDNKCYDHIQVKY